MADHRNELARARDTWLASSQGANCSDGTASGYYLRNRLESAFIAGWEAARAAGLQHRTCTDKVRHDTEAKALVAASRCAARKGVKSLSTYRCPYCKGWHLTSRPRHG